MRSLSTIRAPGGEPTCAASASAIVVLPEPLSPPIAMRRAGCFSQHRAGEVEVRPCFGRNLLDVSRTVVGLGSSHVRPNRGANSHEERQEHEAVFIVGLVEVAIGDKIGEVGKTAMPQIHQQESEIIEHVDSGDLVIELDAVEQSRLTVQHADVAQVQIAMAAAHLAGGLTAIEQRCVTRERGTERCVEGHGFAARAKMPAGGKARLVDVKHG